MTLKTSNIALALTAMLAFTAFTSCNSEKSTKGNDNAPSANPVGSWQWSGPLPARMGTAQFNMELQEDGTCEIIMQEQTVQTALSTNRIKRIELKGKWSANGDSLETVIRIKKWESIFPNSEISQQEYDDYDVIWNWKLINEDEIKFDAINFLLFSVKGQKELTMGTQGSYVSWSLENLERMAD